MDTINKFDIRTSIIEKVIDVFDMMLSMEVEPYDDVSQLTLDGDRVVGSVSFAGEVIGIVNIYVSEPFSRIITASMLGMEVAEIEGEEEVKDVLGEVTNMIGGKLKSDFSDAGLSCVLSTPSITSGTDFKIESMNMARYERFAFRYQEHTVFVETGIKLNVHTGADVHDLVAETEKQPGPIDVDLIKTMDIRASIADKVIDVFNMMLSMEVEKCDAVLESVSNDPRMVTSVNFSGEAMGIINIQVSDSFAGLMTASMLGMEVEEIEGEEDIKDVLGEVSNMIGGKLKSDFSDAGLSCVLSTPSITSGTDFKIESLNMDRHEQFSFRYKDHAVTVEVAVKMENLAKYADESHPSEVTETLKTIEVPAQEEAEEVPRPLKAIEDAPQEEAEEVPRPLETIEDAPQEEAEEVPRPLETIEDAPQEEAEEVPPPLKTIEDVPHEKPPAATKTLKTTKEPDQKKSIEVTKHTGIGSGLDFLLDIPLEMSIELGRTKMSIDELLHLGDGSVVELTALEREPVDILIGEKLIARGEVVIEDGKYGIRITEIMSRMERIKSLG
ncbi:MAG: flagellar motor switch protein FliN [Deltaproteobacteria bacterium]|nr:flagellar motor switch protein FliN [Deltaproteobacteria bacterium]